MKKECRWIAKKWKKKNFPSLHAMRCKREEKKKETFSLYQRSSRRRE
jgi:hypothetical protein